MSILLSSNSLDVRDLNFTWVSFFSEAAVTILLLTSLGRMSLLFLTVPIFIHLCCFRHKDEINWITNKIFLAKKTNKY